MAFQQGGQFPGEPRRRRHRYAGWLDRESATQVKRVERIDGSAPQRGQREGLADGIAPGVHGAQLRTHVQVDPARSEHPVRTATGRDGGGELRFVHAELAAPGADREDRERLRRDIRVEPVEDVEPNAATLCRPSQRLGLVR